MSYINQQDASRFAVFPRYEAVDMAGERVIRIHPDDEQVLGFENLKKYSASDFEGIYAHFAKIRTERTALDFVKQYGLIGLSGDSPSNPQDLTYHMDPESVTGLLSEANKMQELLNLWYSPYMPDVIQVMGKPFNYFKSLVIPLIKHLVPPKELDKKTLVKIYVAHEIAKRVGALLPIIRVTEAGDIFPAFRFSSIKSFIWYRLYTDITTAASFKQSPFCLQPHAARGKFCPPPPTYKKSKCKSAYELVKNRKWRIIQELLNNGASVSEAAQKTNVKQHLIQYWIEEAAKEAPANERQH